MGKSSWFWDRIANHYSKQAIADEASYQKKLQITQEYLKPEMNVFEFGCGTGSTAITHAPFVKDILAIDSSAKMLEIAKQKTSNADLTNLTFDQTDIESFQAANESYDVIMGHSILHLVDDKDAVIKKVYALLKPNGLFVSSTACIGEMGILLRLLAPVFQILPFMPNVKAFTQNQLENSMIENGFILEKSWLPGKNKAVFLIARKGI